MIERFDSITEVIHIVDNLGAVYRPVEEFEQYEKGKDYKYRGYRRINGVVYHTFVYSGKSTN